ncbi:hypothetical protein CXF40_02850 [Corynebacterium bovis]|uniref:DUF3710 domain-containing protein n=1 Tax=Corynebacterium bovis TaxID=36808 RepID=A0A3R8QK97_9CORY|nr:DUF3710 domain-containing protein [Corynebacterium bovis]RRO92767.1 hypothetical protein CXF40_02850 [Corynebacterium bovis]RRQ00478.1 hypothetical protein CXF41_06735 [Corynebacterium bovis]RRQ03686.1 hypothetical protein CXF39_03720 [Corynebacterium bovis]RRQ03997.1 hypothetical protein CXF42_05475 [Corynebacterium bovis]
MVKAPVFADAGPWDGSDASVSEVSRARHMLDDRHCRVGVDVDVPYRSVVCAPSNRAGVLLVQPPDSVVTFTVSVLAWPGDAGWSELVPRITAALRRDLRLVVDVTAADTAADGASCRPAVVEAYGVFGSEVHLHAGSRRETVFLGASGPRWVVRVTAHGVDVTAGDIEVAYQMLASMVVYRGGQALPPGEALSMARVVDPAHREQITSREADDEIARRIWQQASLGAVA